MADHARDTDPADDVDERTDNIARAVKDYLREGDAFLVHCQEDEIIVEETAQSRFQRDHPRLYGRLLSLEDQMETGCGLTIALFALGGVFCLSLQVGWWDPWIDARVIDALRSWWFYVPLFVALFFFSDFIYRRVEYRAYRRGREALHAMMCDEGFDRDTLVPILHRAGEFAKVARQLKLDRGPFRSE